MNRQWLTAILAALGIKNSAGRNGEPLKVLMVGNSFSQSVLAYLPAMVAAEGRHRLTLAQMYIGGCCLDRHINELKEAEKDPNHRPYGTNYQLPGKSAQTNLPEMIKLEKWDIVTVQQGSHES